MRIVAHCIRGPGPWPSRRGGRSPPSRLAERGRPRAATWRRADHEPQVPIGIRRAFVLAAAAPRCRRHAAQRRAPAAQPPTTVASTAHRAVSAPSAEPAEETGTLCRGRRSGSGIPSAKCLLTRHPGVGGTASGHTTGSVSGAEASRPVAAGRADTQPADAAAAFRAARHHLLGWLMR